MRLISRIEETGTSSFAKSRGGSESREGTVQFLGRNKSQVRAIKGRRRGREKERDIAGGNRRGSCSWRRYASHETKLIEKKQFVEGRRGEEEEEEEVKVLRQWRRRGGRPPERINTTLARRSNERVFRGSPNPIQEKKEKGGEGDSRGSPWRE